MKRLLILLMLLPTMALADTIYNAPYNTDFKYCAALYSADGTTLAVGLTLQAADCKVVEHSGTVGTCSVSAFSEAGTNTGVYCGTITAATMDFDLAKIVWRDDSAGGEFLEFADSVRTFCAGGTGSGCALESQVSVDDISTTALAKFVTEDTGEVSAAAGSVAILSGGAAGGGTDWTSGEREQIRDALGVAGTKAAASGGDLQAIATTTTTIDGKVDTIDANVDAILDDTGTSGAICSTVNDKTGYALSAAGVTSIVDGVDDSIIETEGSITRQQAESVMLSVLAGETTNSGLTFQTPDGNATRVTAAVDGSANRTTMTLNPASP